MDLCTSKLTKFFCFFLFTKRRFFFLERNTSGR